MTTPPPETTPWGVPAKVPPYGLAYVAGALEEAGFIVQILDNYQLQNTVETVKLEVKKRDPDIVGISCSSVTYERCIETAKAIKEVKPSCKVVAGGWHPSFKPDSMLEHPEIDYVVIGEGEFPMVELAKLIAKDSGNDAIAKVAGIGLVYTGKIVKNPPKIVDNLDELPYPAWHLFPMDIYDRRMEYLSKGAEPVDVINAIRGCNFNCAYCDNTTLYGRKCRFFSPKRLVDEAELMTKNLGSKGFYFIGDNFTINKNHTLEFCRLLKKRNINIEWVCDTRVDLITRDLLREMKSAGCKTIFFGIQSGAPEILKKLNINFTIDQVVEGFKLCRQEGIQIAASFMLGIPGETVADMETTYKFVRKLSPDFCTFYVFIGIPYSSLYAEVLEKGIYDRRDGFLAFVKTDQFNYELVTAIQKRYQRGYNLSRRRLYRKMKRDGIGNFVKQGLAFGLQGKSSKRV
jgi:anaerobic magnesium-protoporphyrin IX monomethyl ester cyclase